MESRFRIIRSALARLDETPVRRHRVLGFAIQVGLLMLFGVMLALPASAQMDGTALGDVGNTRLQRQLGNYINAICPGLQGSENASRADLALQCTILVQTANEIEGVVGVGVEQSLGLSESELNGAVDDIAHRQLPATAKSSSEISVVHTAAVSQRLYTLRRDWGSDIMIAGTLQDNDGNSMPLHYQWSRESSAAGIKDYLPEGLGIYLNGVGSFGHRDSEDEELGFDYRNLGFTMGSDYRVSDTAIVGGAFSYLNSLQDFNSNKGEIDVNTVAFSGYAAKQIQNFYVNAIATYAHAEVDLEREINYGGGAVDRTAKGDTSSDEFSIAAGGGYEFEYQGLTYGPMMEWEWIWLEIRSFTESGADGLNLEHSHDSMTSATVDLGLEGSFPISTRFGVVVPQLTVAWAHQFEDDSREIRARYEFDNTGAGEGEFFVKTDSPDRNYAKISTAISMQFKRGLSGFASYQALVGHNRLSLHAFTFGGRMSF